MQKEITLLPIGDLVKKKFLIPNYQRGYRWDRQQVRDLLEDIKEFMGKSSNARDDFYCLQPLVVCETIADGAEFVNALPKDVESALQKTRDAIEEHVEWEVIDGQQRLTTIHILLSFLKSRPDGGGNFTIRYATRSDSKSFLENIAVATKESAETDIDFWHMHEAYDEIKTWFADNAGIDTVKFTETLLSKVQFIWYVSREDPIKVFTRLNIGKIGLTNSELIKALFLNKSNFPGDDAAKIRLRQIEIATRWDQMETTLQDDEFWMFLHEPGFDRPTRIDFIFDLVCELDMLDEYVDESLLKDKEKVLGKDGYRTFRYFNAYFKSEKAKRQCNATQKSQIEMCWDKVDDIFASFREWFDDLRLYHYVGFLVARNIDVAKIYKEWIHPERCTKSAFINDYLVPTIKNEIAACNDLDKQYEMGNEDGKNVAWKTQCRPLLLLHNLQTVINQNARQSIDGRSGVFYKFPFHLYKTEGWDIEHIDSNSANEFDDDKSKVEYLVNVYSAVSRGLQKEIIDFGQNNSDFEELKERIENELDNAGNEELLNDSEKNRIWNFALLDSHTNRSYGNAIFSAKRRIIIGKDKGRYLPVPRLVKDKGQLKIKPENEAEAPSTFIPPCTRQVFLKYYSSVATSPNYWTKADAEAYRENIYETLKDFGVTKDDAGQEPLKGE